MVLADALCAMNLAASVMVNGACCYYQMNEQNERRKEQESILRNAVRSEWKDQWRDCAFNPNESATTKSKSKSSELDRNYDEDAIDDRRHLHETKEELLKRKRDKLVRQYHESFSSQLEAQRQQILMAQKQFEIYSSTNNHKNQSSRKRRPLSIRTVVVPGTKSLRKRSSVNSFVAASDQQKWFVNSDIGACPTSPTRSIRVVSSSLLDGMDDGDESDESDDELSSPAKRMNRINRRTSVDDDDDYKVSPPAKRKYGLDRENSVNTILTVDDGTLEEICIE